MNKFMLLLTIILMDLLSGMEFDLFVPSFAELQNYFHLSAFGVEALLSINFIGYCLSLFLVGALADRYGRKAIILIGLLLFLAGTIFCLHPFSYFSFLFGRLLQGVGIAAPAILSFLVVADNYALKQQQRLMAVLNAIMNMAVAIAPVIGSYLTLYFHWQGNFIALLFSGVLVVVMTILFIPKTKLLNVQTTLFAYRDILQSKPLMLLIIHIVLMFVPYWIFVGMSPLLYIKTLGVKLAYFGYYQGMLALLFALGSFAFSFFIDQFSMRKWLVVAMLIFISSLVSLASITVLNSKQALFITLAFIPFVIAQVIPSAILYPVALNFMPEAKGRVAGLIQAGRLVVAALALQFVSFIYQNNFRDIGLIICFFHFHGDCYFIESNV